MKAPQPLQLRQRRLQRPLRSPAWTRGCGSRGRAGAGRAASRCSDDEHGQIGFIGGKAAAHQELQTAKRGEMLVKSRLITALAASAAMALLPSIALAQRQAPPTPEQRIDRLERQVQQMQRQLFPKGRPADTAGFSDDPAATQSSVVTLDQRLDALEKQMADLVRMSEENGNRLRSVETGLGQLKSDQDQRIAAIEQRMSAAAAAPRRPHPKGCRQRRPFRPSPSPGRGRRRPRRPPMPQVPAEGGPEIASAAVPAADPGEDAYTQGFRLWEAGQYDQAISSLKSFTAAYPKHRRVSYANNLIGRSLLDKGDPRSAARPSLPTTGPIRRGACAGQPLLSGPGADEAWPARPGLQGLCRARCGLRCEGPRPISRSSDTDGKSQAQCS